MKFLVALTTPLLLLMTGAGLDTAELYRARINLQNAVDAAALMAAKTLAGTGSTQQAAAAGEELFYGNIRNIAADIGDANIAFDLGTGECASTPIVANATLKKRVFFAFMRAATSNVAGAGGHVGIIDGSKKATEDEVMVPMQATAEVRCGGDTFEIVMVLDNSGSMGAGSKMGTLQSASEHFSNTMSTVNGQGQGVEPVKFGIVPFSTMVNVGPENRNASWMDRTGVGTYHHENLNWDLDPSAVSVGSGYRSSSGQPLTRFTLYDNLNISWAGCVESRPHPEHTRDTQPDQTNPASMFVPTFAPDTPDNWTGEYEKIQVTSAGQEICTRFQSKYYYRNGRRSTRSSRKCEEWSDGYRGDKHQQDLAYRPYWDDRIQYKRGEYIGSTSSTQSWQDGNTISEEKYYNNYLVDDHNFPASLGNPREPQNVGSGERQYSRQRWTWKYFNSPSPRDVNNNNGSMPSVLGQKGGPNAFCTATPITPLTSVKSDVKRGLAQMVANGATNIQAGVAWGWRVLSPGEPFTEGRPYTTDNNRKIMILMTDGNNTGYPTSGYGYSGMNKSHYSTWAHSQNKRIFEGFDAIANPNHDYSTFRKAMDEHLIETCENVKAAGISIYSIAFDVPNGSSVKTMLETCASSDEGGQPQYYDAQNNKELVDTFEDIAEKLNEIRITK